MASKAKTSKISGEDNLNEEGEYEAGKMTSKTKTSKTSAEDNLNEEGEFEADMDIAHCPCACKDAFGSEYEAELGTGQNGEEEEEEDCERVVSLSYKVETSDHDGKLQVTAQGDPCFPKDTYLSSLHEVTCNVPCPPIYLPPCPKKKEYCCPPKKKDCEGEEEGEIESQQKSSQAGRSSRRMSSKR